MQCPRRSLVGPPDLPLQFALSPARAFFAARLLGASKHVKIKTIESIPVRLPMKKPVQMAGEAVARAENVFVRIESDSGTVGWGEAAAARIPAGRCATPPRSFPKQRWP